MKIYNELFDENYLYERLDNGLQVYIFHKPDCITSTAAFGTPYGALNIHQKYQGKDYDFNPGIAHFLEHKLFETDEKDIMNDFSAIGANVNALTGYHETVYFFSSSAESIEEPLKMLLDFVQSFSVTEKSVEKEKGIIIEELSMYLQNPITRLLNETYKTIYHHYPLKYDVGGNEESVKAITKAELEECYRINYHPSNMILVITSPNNPEELLKIVKENQASKGFSSLERPVSNNPKEPFEVYKQEASFSMPISNNKQIIAYKLEPNFKDESEAFYQQSCLTYLLESCFSPLNPKYQEWLDKGLINDFFGYEVDFTCNHAYVLFYIEAKDKDTLKTIINEGLSLDNVNEDVIEQLKRKYIGLAFYNINSVENFTLDFIKDNLEGLNFFDEINLLRKINLIDVEKSIGFVEKASIATINLTK